MNADNLPSNPGHAEKGEGEASDEIRGCSLRNHRSTGHGVPKTAAEGLVAAIFVVGLVLWVYSPVLTCGFVTYDDPLYVTKNPRVQAGLSWDGVIWAFSSLFYFYHPLTCVSLMLDVKLFGVNAAGFHLTNLLLHVINVCLVFYFLVTNTGKVSPNACVALLFALHPINVESVAWISERKGLLGSCGFLAAACLYSSYARKPSLARYLGVLFFFCLSLMAKSTFVTFPLLLLLFDFWPLRRFPARAPGQADETEKQEGQCRPLSRLLAEKIPFFIISILFCFLTIVAERRAGAIAQVPVGFPVRVGSSLVAYLRYMEDFFWPARLSVLYPQTGSVPVGQMLVALSVLTSVSVLVVARSRQRPYLFVGWFFFVIALGPMSGIVQVGWHFMADRYAFVPLLPFYVAMVWGLPRLFPWFRKRPWLMTTAMAATVCALGLATRTQLGVWHDSMSLFRKAVANTSDNFVAHSNLGVALGDHNQPEEALEQALIALEINPFRSDHYFNLGLMLSRLGDYRGARSRLLMAHELDPRKLAVLQQLASVLVLCPVRGDRDRNLAVRFAEDAVHRKPPDARGLAILAAAYSAIGRFNEALVTAGKAQSLAMATHDFALARDIEDRQKVYQEALSLGAKSPITATARP